VRLDQLVEQVERLDLGVLPVVGQGLGVRDRLLGGLSIGLEAERQGAHGGTFRSLATVRQLPS
jgi:hypothetical protein